MKILFLQIKISFFTNKNSFFTNKNAFLQTKILDTLFSLIWIQTVCKHYQQATLRVQATRLLYKINKILQANLFYTF